MLHSRKLQYLDEVARSGSIRKAASQLNVASSAVNRQILALEREFGAPIFERTPRNLRLTAAGKILIEHVRETLNAYGKVGARLRALKGLHIGTVTIAVAPGLAAGPMPQIVADFIARHPGIRIHMRGLRVEAIPAAVLGGDVDLGLGFNLLPKAGLIPVMSIDMPFGAVFAPGHPLTRKSRIRMADTAGYPLVLTEPDSNLRTLVDLAFARHGLQPSPAVETNAVEILKFLVAEGARITFLNPLDVSRECADGRLVFRRISEASPRPQPLALVARGNGPLDPISQLFAEELRVVLPRLKAQVTQQPARERPLNGRRKRT